MNMNPLRLLVVALAGLLSSCYIHYASVQESRFSSQDEYYERLKLPAPVKVDFQYFLTNADHMERLTEMVDISGALVRDSNSNLIFRTYQSGFSGKPFPGPAVSCTTLLIIPSIGKTEHSSRFVLYEKSSGDVLYQDLYSVNDYNLFGWIFLPLFFITPFFDNFYMDLIDQQTREIAMRYFLSRLKQNMRKSPQLTQRLLASARMTVPRLKVRIVSLLDEKGVNRLSQYIDSLQSGLPRQEIDLDADGTGIIIQIMRTFYLPGGNEYQIRLSIDRPGGQRREVQLFAPTQPGLLVEKLAPAIKSIVYEPSMNHD